MDPGHSQVKVLDFGIAKVLVRAGETLTMTGEMVGTLLYMAPEQSSGRGITPATDVYSLGAVMFEAIAGRLPYRARTIAELLWLQASAPVPSLSSFCPGISDELDDLVARCLAKKPENRYRDAAELARELAAIRAVRADGEAASSTKTLRVNPSLWVGSILDERYELHEWLAPGRFRSHVYRATHLRTGASVAVRVWRTGKGVVRDFLIEAFRNEARAMGVRHSNLIAIVDLGYTDDCVYIVTEFVDSLSLRELFQARNALPRDLCSKLVRGAAEALVALHGRNIVSGGLSPETIRVTGSVDEPGQLLLSPLGLTHLKQMEALVDPQDNDGDLLRDYMSPEQKTGATPDPRSDIYSLGLVLVEMIGGRVHQHALEGTPPGSEAGDGDAPRAGDGKASKAGDKASKAGDGARARAGSTKGPGAGEGAASAKEAGVGKGARSGRGAEAGSESDAASRTGAAAASAGRSHAAVPTLPGGLPADWSGFLTRAIALRPDDRFQTVTELLAALPRE